LHDDFPAGCPIFRSLVEFFEVLPDPESMIPARGNGVNTLWNWTRSKEGGAPSQNLKFASLSRQIGRWLRAKLGR